MRRRVVYLMLPLRRLASYRLARRHARQMCKRCGQTQDTADFCVSESTWNTVVPPRWRRWALCLACFDSLAAERGVHTIRVFLVNGP